MSALYCSALSLTIIAYLSLSPSLCGSVLPAMVWAADEKCVAPLRPIAIELRCWNTLLWLKLYNKDWEELKKHMFQRIVSRNSCEMSERLHIHVTLSYNGYSVCLLSLLFHCHPPLLLCIYVHIKVANNTLFLSFPPSLFFFSHCLSLRINVDTKSHGCPSALWPPNLSLSSVSICV